MTAQGPLDADGIDALRELRAYHTDARIALIGATALGFADAVARQTRDVDVTISVGLDALLANTFAPPTWQRDARREHRWTTRRGVLVDLLPASSDLISKRQIEWPKSGMVMSLVGFRHLFAEPEAEIVPGLRVHVAPPHLVLLLKMVAYLDRPAERSKDLGDIAHLFDDLLKPWDDEWIDLNESMIEAGVEAEQASAFALGTRLGPMIDEEERRIVGDFLAKMRPSDLMGSPLLAKAPARWRRVDGELDRMLDAFETGLQFQGRSIE